MNNPQPLTPTPTPEVPLPQAPLVRVIAQARFPAILAIRNPDRVAEFQEILRTTYPVLSQDQVHNIELTGGQTPNVRQCLIWRLADRDARWRVSLGVDFVALETSLYESRNDFLCRLAAVLSATEATFQPALANRLGLRYIDRLTDEAVDRVGDLIRPEVLGIIRPPRDPHFALGESVIHQMTEVQFLVRDGACVQGHWGLLPRNTTYDPNALEPVDKRSWVLDLDMFTAVSKPFASEELLTIAESFAECIYWLFRQTVTEEFLRFYGGQP